MASHPPFEGKIALVYGTLPSIDEINQLQPILNNCQIDLIASEAIISYLSQNIDNDKINCIVLPEHDENPTFLPGLEEALTSYKIVIVKERIGIYAYQVVKAKWRNKFRLFTWIDNIKSYPSEDLKRLRTIRTELGQSTDGFIVQSDDAKKALLIEGVPASMIYHLAPYTVQRHLPEKSDRYQAKEKLGYKDNDWVLVHEGPIEWEENLLELLTAIKILRDEDRSLAHRIHLCLSGVGSFSTEVKKYAELLGIDDQVAFHTPSLEVQQNVIHAADCYYLSQLPSKDRLDGDPFRLIRPMTYKKPILASRSPLVEEIVGKHRIDFCLGSPFALAKAMKKAIYSTALLKDIAAKNFHKVQKSYQLSKFVANWNQMLEIAQGKAMVEESAPITQKILQAENRFAAKQFVEAIEIIEDIFKRKDLPRHQKSNLYRLIGDCFTKLGDGESGKYSYIQALELDPYLGKAHIGLGTISLTRDKYDIAVIHFQKAVSFSPKDDMASLGLGLAFSGINEPQEAQKWILKSLEINPDNAPALQTLLKVCFDHGSTEEMDKILLSYVRRVPENSGIALDFAEILFRQNRFEEALKVLEPLVPKSPTDQKILELVEKTKTELAKLREKTAS